MQLLQAHDAEWHRDCTLGLEFEELAYMMEEEEPDAASVICISLNKTNEAAMKTGHIEIMATLASLCQPDPTSGAVAYQPLRQYASQGYDAVHDGPRERDAAEDAV